MSNHGDDVKLLSHPACVEDLDLDEVSSLVPEASLVLPKGRQGLFLNDVPADSKVFYNGINCRNDSLSKRKYVDSIPSILVMSKLKCSPRRGHVTLVARVGGGSHMFLH